MNTIKVLHFADLHLGSDFRALGRSASARRNELKEVFLEIISLCKKEHVALLLAAGDIFESWSIDAEYFGFVRDGFADIPDTVVAISAGNHDPLSKDSPYLATDFWSDNVIIFTEKYNSVVLDRLGTELWGASFASGYSQAPLLQHSSPKRPDYIQVGVLHGTLVSEGQSSEYNPITPSQIACSGLDYLALGHIHKQSSLTKDRSGTSYAYAGCPEGRGFDELGVKGVLLGEVGKKSADLKMLPVSRRIYVESHVDISSAQTASEAANIIKTKLSTDFGENFENNLYKIFLEGKSSDYMNIDSIKPYLSSIYFVTLRDRTAIDVDIDMLTNSNTLRGIFARHMLSMQNSKKKEEIADALKIGLKAFSGKVDYNED